jgi:hypothetical protein
MRSYIMVVGIALCVFHSQQAQAQVFGVAPGLNVRHPGATVQSAYNYSVAQRELAAGLQDYYGALADQARAHAIRELVEAKALALSSLPGQAGARRDADDVAMAWPAPLDEKRFAADREAANQVLLTWTVSPDGVRNVDKQRLRTALVSLRVKLKRRPTTASSVDYKVADEFLNSVARTVLGPRASLD